MSRLNRLLKAVAPTLCAATLVTAAQGAWAQGKGLEEPVRASYKAALAGKTVAFVPQSMLSDLAHGWYAQLKKELEPLGVKVVLRDPNLNASAGAQAIENLIAEKPAVIVVQNPDVQTNSKVMQRAEAAGIHVIQINLRASYLSSAYVGVDWNEMGERQARAAVQACKGKSGKVAIIQGQLSSAASVYTMKGIEDVFAKSPEIKVVANQAADWDASKAKSITQTILKQHPDVCAVIGFWDGEDVGTAAAIKEAGLTGKVHLITSGGAEKKAACDGINSGAFDTYMAYNVPDQGRDAAAMVKWLIHSGVKPGTYKGSIYTNLDSLTKADVTSSTCWTLAK